MRILTPLQALSAAALLALLAGCSGGSAIAPRPSTPQGYVHMTTGGIVGAVGPMAQLKAIIADVPLGSDSRYAVLAGSTVTNSGPTIVTSNLGLSPGSAVTGFPPGKVIDGKIHAGDAHAAQAQLDLTTAYNNAAGRKNPTKVPADTGGMVITPGLYKAPVSLAITGNLTLDGQNNPNSVFIFQVPSTLITSVNSSITLINMAKPCHIFWQVGSSATLKTGSVFKGVILAQASISLGKGATVEDGRLLARSGAVTLLRNIVTEPGP
jgi:hypothetical protein